MTRPDITPGRFYPSSLLGSPGNYSVEIRAFHDHETGNTDSHVCVIESSRLPVRLLADAQALAALPDLLAALETIHANAAESAEWIRERTTAALTKAGYTF